MELSLQYAQDFWEDTYKDLETDWDGFVIWNYEKEDIEWLWWDWSIEWCSNINKLYDFTRHPIIIRAKVEKVLKQKKTREKTIVGQIEKKKKTTSLSGIVTIDWKDLWLNCIHWAFLNR